MNDQPNEQTGDTREHLEQDADGVRSRLLENLDELKARGQGVHDRVKSVEATLRKHPGILVGAGLVTLLACGVLLYTRRASRRREQRHDAVLAFAARLLGPGYVVEPAVKRPSAIKTSLKRATAALVQEAGRELGRRALVAVKARVGDLEHEGETAPA